MRGERVCGIYRGVVRTRGIAIKSICGGGVWTPVGSQVGPTPWVPPPSSPAPPSPYSPAPPRPPPALPLARPTPFPALPLAGPRPSHYWSHPLGPLQVPYVAPPDTTPTDGFDDPQFHGLSQRPCRCRTPSLLAPICVKNMAMYKRGSSAALCHGYAAFGAFVTHERAYI